MDLGSITENSIRKRSTKSLCELTNSKLRKLKTTSKTRQVNPEKYDNLRLSVHNLNKWLRSKEDAMQKVMDSDSNDREENMKVILGQIGKHQDRLKHIVEIADKVFEAHATDQEIYIVNEYTKFLSIRFRKLQHQIETELKKTDLNVLKNQIKILLIKIHDCQHLLSKYDHNFNQEDSSNSVLYCYNENSKLDINNNNGPDEKVIVVDSNNNHEVFKQNNNIISMCNHLILKYRILFKKYKDEADLNLAKLDSGLQGAENFKDHVSQYSAISDKLDRLEQNIANQTNSMKKTLGAFAVLSTARQCEITGDDVIVYMKVEANNDYDFITMNFRRNSRVYHQGVSLSKLRWRNIIKTAMRAAENKISWKIIVSDSRTTNRNLELVKTSYPTNPLISESDVLHYYNSMKNELYSRLSHQIIPCNTYDHKTTCIIQQTWHDPIYLLPTIKSRIYKMSGEITKQSSNNDFYDNLQVSVNFLLNENEKNRDECLHEHFLKLEELSKTNFQDKYKFLQDECNRISYITHVSVQSEKRENRRKTKTIS